MIFEYYIYCSTAIQVEDWKRPMFVADKDHQINTPKNAKATWKQLICALTLNFYRRNVAIENCRCMARLTNIYLPVSLCWNQSLEDIAAISLRSPLQCWKVRHTLNCSCMCPPKKNNSIHIYFHTNYLRSVYINHFLIVNFILFYDIHILILSSLTNKVLSLVFYTSSDAYH